MRRIYESRALHRDDDDPFSPKERRDAGRSTSFLSQAGWRTVDWESFSHTFMPVWLRNRAISVEIETAAKRYERDDPVEFHVTMRNRLPFPVRLIADSRLRWEWALDGMPAASAYDEREPPADPTVFSFDRGETKRFRRTWNGAIRVSKREWRAPPAGEHVLSVQINVADADDRGLSDSTMIETF